MTRLAFVDCETTGLDPDRNEVWEVALILRDGHPSHDTEHVWQLPVDLARADSAALTIGGYYERAMAFAVGAEEGPTREFADSIARLTHGAHFVGAVPSFDDAFLKRLLRSKGACPGWHYHLIDVEALAAGYIAGRGSMSKPTEFNPCPPWNSNDLSRAVGVNPDDFDRHTAMGDACWVRAIYNATVGG